MCGKFTIYICEILFFSIGEEIVIIMIRIMNINLLKHIIKMGDRNKTKVKCGQKMTIEFLMFLVITLSSQLGG